MWLEVKSAAAIAHCSKSCICSAVAAGELKSEKRGWRVYVDRDSLDTWIRARTIPDGYCMPGEATKRWGVTDTTIRRYIESGQIQSIRGPRNCHWVEIASLDAWAHKFFGRNCRLCGLIPEPWEPALDDRHLCHFCVEEIETGRPYPSLIVANLLPAMQCGRVNGGE